MKSSRFTCLLAALLSLLLVGCGKKAGYEIRGGKVVWNNWRGDGLVGNWSESEVAAAQGFKILEPYEPPCPGYASNGTHVFHGPSVLDGAEAATFHIIDKWTSLSKDARHVYEGSSVIEGADPATYQTAGIAGLGRDKADYYFGTKPLHVRDLPTFQVLDAKAFWKEHHIWARDRLDYYVGRQATPIADSATFAVVQSRYARDAKQVYFGSQVLAGADPATFKGLADESGVFAQDATHVYFQGRVVEGSAAASFTLLPNHYARDHQHAYFCDPAGTRPPDVLPGSEGRTFEVLGPPDQAYGYAKDARQVYWGNKVIPGADPATLVLDPGDPATASDKTRRYRHGDPIEEAPEAKRQP